jgi:hypothetical protein
LVGPVVVVAVGLLALVEDVTPGVGAWGRNAVPAASDALTPPTSSAPRMASATLLLKS